MVVVRCSVGIAKPPWIDKDMPGKLNIQQSYDGKGVNVGLQGIVDLYNKQDLKQVLKQNHENGVRAICLDFTDLISIDSSGLGVLISELRTYMDTGGEIVLAGLNDSLKSVFSITRYEAFFKIFDDVASARKYLKQQYG